MKVVGPYQIQEQRNIELPLPEGGGCLLANGWFPKDSQPKPVILSYYPYHKDDLIGVLFEYPRQVFASHGIIDLLVDFRGTGASDGYCHETFDTSNEGRDLASIIEWVSAQPWCNGKVGVWGMSYGAITALAAAAQRPNALKACLALYGTPDIYHDLIFPGGIPNALGNSLRETFMLAMDMAPPMLQDKEGRWRDVWENHLDRLRAGDVWSLAWNRHSEFDEYWQRRVTDVGDIDAPTFMIGGWNDIFPDGMTSPWNQMRCEKRLVMGPWIHQMPHVSPVAPWDWLSEAVEWWLHWLSEDGVPLTPVPPVRFYDQGEEDWYCASEWPPSKGSSRFYLGSGHQLAADRDSEETVGEYQSDLTFGSRGMLLDPMGTGVGFPLEHSLDVSRALSYFSTPLREALHIAGSPVLAVSGWLLEGDDLDLCVKLVDVNPAGEVTHVASGWLLCNPSSGNHDDVKRFEQEVVLWPTAYTLRKGHRLGVLIACTDFPHVFPPSSRPTIGIAQGGDAGAVLLVPTWTDGVSAIELPTPATPEAIGTERAVVRAEPYWEYQERHSGDETDMRVQAGYGDAYEFALPDGATLLLKFGGTAFSSRSGEEGMRVECSANLTARLSNGERVEVRVRSVATRTSMALAGELEKDGVTILDGSWVTSGAYRSQNGCSSAPKSNGERFV